MNSIAFGLLAASLTSATVNGGSPNPACFSDAEFEDMLLIIAPSALKVMGEQCAAVLPSGSVINNPDSVFAKSLDAASKVAWPRAFPNLLRVMKAQGERWKPGEEKMTREGFIAGLGPILGKIIKDPKRCAHADKVLKLAEPLPPRNLAGIFVGMIRLTPPKPETQLLCPVG